MVGRGVQIADVVEQGGDHCLLVGAVLEGAGRGLQRVLIAVDLVTVAIALEALEQAHHIIGHGHRIGRRNLAQHLVFFARSIRHVNEIDRLVPHRLAPR